MSNNETNLVPQGSFPFFFTASAFASKETNPNARKKKKMNKYEITVKGDPPLVGLRFSLDAREFPPKSTLASDPHLHKSLEKALVPLFSAQKAFGWGNADFSLEFESKPGSLAKHGLRFHIKSATGEYLSLAKVEALELEQKLNES